MQCGRGYVPDKHDITGDVRVGARFGAQIIVPSTHSLESYVEAVRDQQTSNFCVGFALAAGIQTHAAGIGEPIDFPSPVAIVTGARTLERQELGLTPEDAPLEDKGCQPTLAARAMIAQGVPPISKWPFDLAHLNDEPTLAEYESASAWRVRGWQRILSTGPQRLAEIRQAISHGCPVALGVNIDRAFEDYGGRGLLQPSDPKNIVGGHMTLLVGYDATSLRGLNSWTTSWGDGGYYNAANDWVLAASVGDILVVTGELVAA